MVGLVKWAIDASLPFNAFENTYFKDVMAPIFSHYQIRAPERKWVANMVNTLGNDARLRLKQKLSVRHRHLSLFDQTR
jgi:hypothetical protein